MKLLKKYKKEIIPNMVKEFDYDNKLAVPRLKKIIINVGVNKQRKDNDSKYIEDITEIIAKITGQKPRLNNAKKSVAGFNIREGETVGISTILRGEKMWSFLEKLIFVAFPRTRDFRGINPNSVDEAGNLSIGLKNQMCFPEVDSEEIDKSFGFQITIVTSANDRQKGFKLLKYLEVPFKKEEEAK